jgi:ABC-type branched-subunit amino acid transport system substrate-binding protein
MKFRTIWIIIALLAAGGAGRELFKTASWPSTAQAGDAASEAVSQQPSLVDVNEPVQEEDYKKALEEVGGTEVSRRNYESYLIIAQYRFNRSNFEDALKIYQKVLLATTNRTALAKAQYMVGEAYYRKKGYLPSLAAFQNVILKYPRTNYATQARQRMEFMLAYSLSLADLQNFTTNYPDSPLKCSALFSLGSREAQSGKQNQAYEHLTEFTRQCPRHPSMEAAQLLLQPMQNQVEGRSWKIGVLVPLSGRFKPFGDSVKNGVKLAVDQANQSGGSRKLLVMTVKDTAGVAKQAVKVFQDLTSDDSLDAIIGPVSPSEINAVAALANQQKITLITPALSRDGLSEVGPYLFSNSMTNEMQGRAIAKFAVEKLGYKRFGMLAPADVYGETLSEAFREATQAMGATILASATYVAGSTDFKKPLVALGGQDPNSAKETKRDNNRKLDELKYALGKEVAKIALKAGAASDIATALVPFAEALGNTNCPSITADVANGLQAALKKQSRFTLREDDLIQQALTRLPADAKGNTREVSAEQWGEIADDMQASLLVTGRITVINPDDWSEDTPWNYVVVVQAFQLNPKSNTFSRIYQNRLACGLFKSPDLVQSTTGIQAIYLPAHTAEVPLLASQVRFYNLNQVLLGGHLWGNESIFQEGGGTLDGAYFVTGFYVDSRQENVKKFSEDYLKKFAKRPDLLAAQAYDAARLLLKAMDSSGSRDDIQKKLMEIRDFNGVSGRTTFGGHGEADKSVPVMKIQNNKYIQVQ